MCLSMRKSCVLRIDYACADIENFSPLFLKIKQKLAIFQKSAQFCYCSKERFNWFTFISINSLSFLINKLFKICVFMNMQSPSPYQKIKSPLFDWDNCCSSMLFQIFLFKQKTIIIQLFFQNFVIWTKFSDQIPKFWWVIHLFAVTKFMNYNISCQIFW